MLRRWGPRGLPRSGRPHLWWTSSSSKAAAGVGKSPSWEGGGLGGAVPLPRCSRRPPSGEGKVEATCPLTCLKENQRGRLVVLPSTRQREHGNSAGRSLPRLTFGKTGTRGRHPEAVVVFVPVVPAVP